MIEDNLKPETATDANTVLAVRCINPMNTGLKTDKIYKVTKSENFKDCYILDVGWNWILSKNMFEVVELGESSSETQIVGQNEQVQDLS